MSVATGAGKLQRKLGEMQRAYAAAVPQMPTLWVEGLRLKAGIQVGPIRQANYQSGLQGAAERYATNLAIGAPTWEANYRRAMGI